MDLNDDLTFFVFVFTVSGISLILAYLTSLAFGEDSSLARFFYVVGFPAMLGLFFLGFWLIIIVFVGIPLLILTILLVVLGSAYSTLITDQSPTWASIVVPIILLTIGALTIYGGITLGINIWKRLDLNPMLDAIFDWWSDGGWKLWRRKRTQASEDDETQPTE